MCLHSEGQGQFCKAREGERERMKNSAALDVGWEATEEQGS